MQAQCVHSCKAALRNCRRLKLETTPTKTHQLRKEAANKGIAGTICVHQLVVRNACHLQYITVQSSAVSMT